MKAYLVVVLSLFFSLSVFAQSNSSPTSTNSADRIINSYQANGLKDTLINNKETAIAVAEAILFNIYGKQQIESEKPYNVVYKDGCWFISGSLPKGYVGGVFSIALNAKDGKAVVFPHGK